MTGRQVRQSHKISKRVRQLFQNQPPVVSMSCFIIIWPSDPSPARNFQKTEVLHSGWHHHLALLTTLACYPGQGMWSSPVRRMLAFSDLPNASQSSDPFFIPGHLHTLLIIVVTRGSNFNHNLYGAPSIPYTGLLSNFLPFTLIQILFLFPVFYLFCLFSIYTEDFRIIFSSPSELSPS